MRELFALLYFTVDDYDRLRQAAIMRLRQMVPVVVWIMIISAVSADGSSQSFGGLTAQIGWFGLRIGGHPALSLHSSNEPGELSQ